MPQLDYPFLRYLENSHLGCIEQPNSQWNPIELEAPIAAGYFDLEYPKVTTSTPKHRADARGMSS
jgi:hypothetical protein